MRIILSGLVLLCAGLTGRADSVRFALMADTHSGTAHYGTSPAIHTFSTAMAGVASNCVGAAFGIIAGDLTDDGEATVSEWQVHTNGMTNFTSFAVNAVPGNHDWFSYSDGTPTGRHHANWDTYVGYTNSIITNGNYIFVGFVTELDTNLDNAGSVSTVTLNWLTNALATHSQYHAVVYTHYAATNSSPSGWGVKTGQGQAELISALSTYNVAMYLHGHTHNQDMANSLIGSTIELNLPSLAYGIIYNTDSNFLTGAWVRADLSGSTLTLVEYERWNSIPHTTNTFTVPTYFATLSSAGPETVISGAVRFTGNAIVQ